MKTKTCKRCGETKALDNFTVSKSNKGGYVHECKKCNAARARFKYKNDADLRAQRLFACSNYYQRNRAKVLARVKAYADARRDEINVKQRQKRESNMSKVIKMPTAAKPGPDADFYRKLAVPPSILEWLSYHKDCPFTVFADPITGKLAGIIRRDIFEAQIAKAKGLA